MVRIWHQIEAPATHAPSCATHAPSVKLVLEPLRVRAWLHCTSMNEHLPSWPLLWLQIMFEIAQSDFWFEEVVAAGYEYVMLADDDLVIDTCSLNQFFDTMKRVRTYQGHTVSKGRQGWLLLVLWCCRRCHYRSRVQLVG